MLNEKDKAEAVYRIQKAGFSQAMVEALEENRIPLDVEHADLHMSTAHVADFAEVLEKVTKKTVYGAIALNLNSDPAIGYLMITPEKAEAGDHELYQDKYPYCLVIRLTRDTDVMEGFLSLEGGKTRLYQIGSE